MAEKKTTKTKVVKAKKLDLTRPADELQKDLQALQAEHLESRKSHRAGELVNPHVLTVQRKNIARLLTAINAAAKEEN